jgi:hypothetical protein
MSIDKDYLEEDLNTITRINELVKNIAYPHQVTIVVYLDRIIKSLSSLYTALFGF